MKAVHLESYGGPEVLRLIDVETRAAGPGQIVVRNKAIGFNYLETRQRRGDYPLPIPGGIGAEAAGIVESVGSGVSAFSPGERVAYVSARPGADAEAMAVEADRAFILPASVSFEAAAASIIKGMTAEVLLKPPYPVKPGRTILVWAAAGRVWQHLVRWASQFGARVIAVVGSEVKVSVVRSLSAEMFLESSRYDIDNDVGDLL